MERDRELEGAETWDLERPEVREPVEASRVIVSVAFQRDDFNQVSEYAALVGKRTSAFIREAAIEKVVGCDEATLVYGSGSGGSQWWVEQMPSATLAFLAVGSHVDYPEETIIMTY